MGLNKTDILLVVGKDMALLTARSAVLKSAGFYVLRAHDEEQARMASELVKFLAVLICHSFDAAAQDELERSLRAGREDLAIFKLQAYECEPKQLLSMVQQVVMRDNPAETAVGKWCHDQVAPCLLLKSSSL